MSDPLPRDIGAGAAARPDHRASQMRRVVAVILVLFSAIPYASIFFSAPRFAGLFSGFGAELPALTRLALATYQYVPLLLLFSLVPCVSLFAEPDGDASIRRFAFVVLGFVLALFVLFVYGIAVYMPIFKMGAAV